MSVNPHISDDLPRLLTGEAEYDTVMAAAEHLRTCPDCQQELVSAVVAHASLTSAHRFAPEVVSPPPSRRTPSSPAGVVPLHTAEASDDEDGTDAELPDMSAVFTRVRDEAARRSAQRTTAAPRTRRTLLVAAAAAVVLAAGGVGIGYAVDGGSATTGRTVALNAYGVGHTDAKAVLTDDTVTLDATSLPKVSDAQRYEVWLTNGARTKMYPIGFLGDGSKASFTVQREQLERYSDIEVSLQPAGEIGYSHISVLRGSYSD